MTRPVIRVPSRAIDYMSLAAFAQRRLSEARPSFGVEVSSVFTLGERIDPAYRPPGRHCRNKRAFDSLASAEDRLHVLLLEGNIEPSTRVYRCHVCSQWHLGRPRWRPLDWYRSDPRRADVVPITPGASS